MPFLLPPAAALPAPLAAPLPMPGRLSWADERATASRYRRSLPPVERKLSRTGVSR